MLVGGVKSVYFGHTYTPSVSAGKMSAFQTHQSSSSSSSSGTDLNSLMDQLDEAIGSTTTSQNSDSTQSTTNTNQTQGTQNTSSAQNTQQSQSDDPSSIVDQMSLPDISGLMAQVQSNPSLGSSIDSLISSFLINNFGGNEEAVIKTLLGKDQLSPKIQSMESSIFNEVVSKLASQVSAQQGNNIQSQNKNNNPFS